jgi:hypothetical protein
MPRIVTWEYCHNHDSHPIGGIFETENYFSPLNWWNGSGRKKFRHHFLSVLKRQKKTSTSLIFEGEDRAAIKKGFARRKWWYYFWGKTVGAQV